MPDTAAPISIAPMKFTNPDVTLDGQVRASVAFQRLETLWFNTGTLCNIECANCYIESSPGNDRLIYLTTSDVTPYLDEIDTLGLGCVEIGFTGGEPFMNPSVIELMELALARGHRVLMLTNAMRPMMRDKVRAGLADLNETYGDALMMRVSLDHYTSQYHDAERGTGGFEATLQGMDWLRDHDFAMSVAGRAMWGESTAIARAGFARLFHERGYNIPAQDPGRLLLFPEMDIQGDPPEITESCWGILGKSPSSVMCSSSRMVVRRKGASAPAVLSCTLLPYEDAFELSPTLEGSLKPVKLNHKFCAQFCVLGGASCS